MRKIVFINGGAGRMLCALPALEKFAQNNPDGIIVSEAGMDFILGNPNLQDRTYPSNHKDLFEQFIKDGEIISPEPYRDNDYYNQKCSIGQAFDKLINGTPITESLPRAQIFISKEEEINGMAMIKTAKEAHKKKKTVIIQPYGRGVTLEQNLGVMIDTSSRSLETSTYLALAKAIREKYNLICMTEIPTPNDEFAIIPKNVSLRYWAAAIDQCDYFIGCDSVGQHLAYTFQKPGAVILGSTFAENVTYPKYFKIYEKKNAIKKYSPIRVSDYDCHLADKVNDTVMNFSKQEEQEMIKNIMKDIKEKVGE
jgi:ADP-heptose:LPS heptosyltransferase